MVPVAVQARPARDSSDMTSFWSSAGPRTSDQPLSSRFDLWASDMIELDVEDHHQDKMTVRWWLVIFQH